RDRRAHRAQQGAAAGAAAGGGTTDLLGLPLWKACRQDAGDEAGLRLVRRRRDARWGERCGSHALVGAAQIGMGGLARHAERLRRLAVPLPRRARVLTRAGPRPATAASALPATAASADGA